jgi:hypothetical protein
MIGLGDLVGRRKKVQDDSSTNQEAHVARKAAEVMEATSGALEGVLVPLKEVVALSRDESKLPHDAPPREQVIFTGSVEWTPEEAEHYIDRRIQLLDLEIARVRERLDDLIGMRKRWLAVTGGRSKMYANGNGHAGANGA